MRNQVEVSGALYDGNEGIGRMGLHDYLSINGMSLVKNLQCAAYVAI